MILSSGDTACYLSLGRKQNLNQDGRRASWKSLELLKKASAPPTVWKQAGAPGHHLIGLSSLIPRSSSECLSPKLLSICFLLKTLLSDFLSLTMGVVIIIAMKITNNKTIAFIEDFLLPGLSIKCFLCVII